MKQFKIDLTTCIFFVMSTLILIFNFNGDNFLGIPAYIWSNAFIVLFVAWIVANVIKTNGFLVWNRVFTWALLFVLMCLISVSYSYAREDSYSKTITMLIMVIMAIAIYQYVSEEENLRHSLIAFVWAAFFAAIYLFGNSSITLSDMARIGDALGDANLVGITFAIAVAVAIHLLKTETVWYKWIYAVQIAVMTVATLFTGSRTAFMLIFAAITLNLLLHAYTNHWNIIKVFFLLILIVAISFAFYYAVMNIKPLYDILGIRILSFTQIMRGEESIYHESSTQTRGMFARRAFDWFLNSPAWLGHGIGAFASYNQTFSDGWYCFCHCGYLEVLCGVGIPGEVLFYGSFIRFLKGMVTRVTDKMGMEYCILLGTLTIEFLFGEIFLVMYYEKTTWIIFALMAGIYEQVNKRKFDLPLECSDREYYSTCNTDGYSLLK